MKKEDLSFNALKRTNSDSARRKKAPQDGVLTVLKQTLGHTQVFYHDFAGTERVNLFFVIFCGGAACLDDGAEKAAAPTGGLFRYFPPGWIGHPAAYRRFLRKERRFRGIRTPEAAYSALPGNSRPCFLFS